MAVGDVLDFTPKFTMSTLQTGNDIANICINSLLLVLILVNIGSAVSKLVYFTRGNTFNYRSWLRAFVFVNSDDPLRLFGWFSRKYMYRESEWTRYPNKIHLKRLILPLLARSVIFIVSIASIAISIPQDKVLNGCTNGDYRVTFDTSKSTPNQNFKSICSEVPLISNLGDPNTTVSHCMCPTQSSTFRTGLTLPGVSIIGTSIDSTAEALGVLVFSDGMVETSLFYIEWKPKSTPDKTFRSMLSQRITLEAFTELVNSWFLQDNPECTFFIDPDFENDDITMQTYTCEVNAKEAHDKILSRLRTSIQWERTEVVQQRRVVETIRRPGVLPDSSTYDSCVVPVIVNRPIVNMAPLAILLAAWTVVNFVISSIVSRHDNALDAAFHIIKEALGHDTTSNPLEECTEHEQITSLKFKKWHCGGGGGHVGFMGRQGDVPVEKFEASTVVSGCAIVATEHERARALYMAPTGFAAPDQSVSLSNV